MASSTVHELKQLIAKLQAERAEHHAAIEQIDEMFSQLGMSSPSSVGRGRPRGRGRKAVAPAASTGGKRRRRKRGSFPISGEESVINFVKSKGSPTTAEINAHWQREGRKGKADNTLTKLTKSGRLRRINEKGVRGSRYKA